MWLPRVGVVGGPRREKWSQKMNATELEAYLHEHIPISNQMGIQVVRADLECVTLRAPLEPNINHRDTVFGGSCASVAMLAAWSLVLLRVRGAGRDAPIVIQHGEMDYLAPIDAAFSATCYSADQEVWARVLRTLDRGRPARVELTADVECASKVVARMVASYVAVPTREF
jgi:thioesterase domain-containing protein